MQNTGSSAGNRRPETNDARGVGFSLRELHLTDYEERVYRRLLLCASGMPVAEISADTGLSGSRLFEALAGLEKRDLTHRRGCGAALIVARPPEQAFAEMLAEHEEHLTQARRRIDELSRLYQSCTTQSADVVDVIVGEKSIIAHFDHMQRMARNQVRGCDRPPYTERRDDIHPVQQEQINAGVRYRILYDPVVLSLPQGVERMRRSTKAGEQIRLLTDLPIKLGIADDQLAMMSLGNDGGEPSVLLVHPSVLLDSLIALFETLWRFSTPLRKGCDASTSEFSHQERELLGLLAAGVTEETMARRLGIGLRTVQRRTQELMETLGVNTRFQAGMVAANRGLI